MSNFEPIYDSSIISVIDYYIASILREGWGRVSENPKEISVTENLSIELFSSKTGVVDYQHLARIFFLITKTL